MTYINITYILFCFSTLELVPYFTQMPTSYIAYRGLRTAHKYFDIKLSFKPESSEGKKVVKKYIKTS